MSDLFSVIVVLTVIGLQIFIFYKTYKKIRTLAGILPIDVDSLKSYSLKVNRLTISKYLFVKMLEVGFDPEIIKGNKTSTYISAAEYSKKIVELKTYYKNSKDISNNEAQELAQNDLDHDSIFKKTGEEKEITFISSSTATTTQFASYLEMLNTFLIKNSSVSTDFHIIKDMLTRRLDSLEDEIERLVPIPIYLGLTGTVLGLILSFMLLPEMSGLVVTNPSLINTKLTEFLNGVEGMLGGAKVALYSTFSGIVLTMITSVFHRRSSRKKLENRLDYFLTFLQVELIPSLNLNINSNILTLSESFTRFNESFATNLDKFTAVTEDTKNSSELNLEILEELKNVDLEKLAKGNVIVLKELKKNIAEFEKLAFFLNDMNTFSDNAKQILEKTESIDLIAKNIQESILYNTKISKYIDHNLVQIEQIGDIHKTGIKEISNSLQQTLSGQKSELNEIVSKNSQAISTLISEFQSFTKQKEENLKEATSKETSKFIDILNSNTNGLDNLKHIKTLSIAFKEGSDAQKQAFEQFTLSIVDLNSRLRKQNDQNAQNQRYNILFQVGRLFNRIMNIFK